MTDVTFAPRPMSVSDDALARFMNYAHDCGVSPDEMLTSYVESFAISNASMPVDEDGYPVFTLDESKLNIVEPKTDAATGAHVWPRDWVNDD